MFMRRVESDGDWALMCPNECPGLSDVHGKAFDELYEKYEREGKFRKVVKAQKLWFAILDAQVETGGPFMLYKDAANGEYQSVACYGSISDHLSLSQIKPAELGNYQVFQLVH